jgi:DivIVA domain-containing protein
MAITAEDIHNQSFAIDRKGYDVDEVDVFLEHVADEIDYLNDRIAQLEEELEEARNAEPETIIVEETIEPDGITGEIATGPGSPC